MSEPLKRRSLLGPLDAPPPVLPEAVITATAARNGFPTVNLDAEPPVPRRRRQPTGRDHQFNVRLRAVTMEAIYAQANGRNIPVAQVIEEAMQALSKLAGA
jgi:hypothetical protein